MFFPFREGITSGKLQQAVQETCCETFGCCVLGAEVTLRSRLKILDAAEQPSAASSRRSLPIRHVPRF